MRLARQEGSSTQLAWGVRGEGCEDWGQQRGLTISRPQCCSLHASALSTVGQWSMGPVPLPPPPPSRQLSSAARLEAASSSSASVYMMQCVLLYSATQTMTGMLSVSKCLAFVKSSLTSFPGAGATFLNNV